MSPTQPEPNPRAAPPADAAERAAALAFDPLNLPPGFLENPFPTYHLLRRHDPVHRCPDWSYFLTRFADVAAVYRDRRMLSDKTVEFRPKFGGGALFRHHTTSLVFNDPPYHTRVRNQLIAPFTPRALRAMEPVIAGLVERLLDAAEARGGMDLIADFAAAVPVEVICNMLGVPRADRGPLRDYSLRILGALEPAISAEQLAAGNRAVEQFSAYLDGLIAERRRNLSDVPSDVLSALIRGGGEVEPLTQEELIQNCIFLLNAGHETTTNLIGNGVAALIGHPGQMTLLRSRPELIESAVEEFLRFESSNQLGNRRVGAALEIGGVAMAEGTQITLCIGAANRDPAQFPDPDRLDIERRPNPHLAFGAGIHACAGMNLARLEGRIAILRLIQRFPNLHRSGTPARGGRARFRGYAAYPVSW